MKKYIVTLLQFAAVMLLTASSIHAQRWVSLFNGKNLDGWHTLPGGEWKVENGIIAGTSPTAEQKHGLLVSDSVFADFEMEYNESAGSWQRYNGMG